MSKIFMCLIGDKVGDSIAASFMPRELKKLFPQAQLSVMTTAPLDLWKHNPYIDQLFPIPYGNSRWFAILKQLPFLRRQHYDILLVTGESWKRKLCFACIGARRIICLDRCAPRNVHYSLRFEGALKQLGSPAPNTQYELFLSEADRQAALQFMQKNGLQPNNFLVFNPIGADDYRCLSEEKIKAVCIGLRRVLPPEYPVVLLDYKNQYAALDTVCMRSCSTSILQTAALIQQAGYVLTVDTGIAHIADAFAKKMTVLFSLHPFPNEAEAQSHLGRWTPRTAGTLRVCTHGEMNHLSADEIIASVQQGVQK